MVFSLEYPVRVNLAANTTGLGQCVNAAECQISKACQIPSTVNIIGDTVSDMFNSFR